MNANSSISTRDPWLSLPPKGGRGGKNETSLNINPRRPSIDRQAQIPGQVAVRPVAPNVSPGAPRLPSVRLI
jgi:hypothetical protein